MDGKKSMKKFKPLKKWVDKVEKEVYSGLVFKPL